jgi:predicted glycosyltransferase
MNDMARNMKMGLLGMRPATLALPTLLHASRNMGGSARTDNGRRNRIDTELSTKNGQPCVGQLPRVERSSGLERSRPRRVRVALYSHDTMGLGHLRRNLLIAQALAESPLNATTLLITGAHEANFFALPDGADFLTLPRLHKSEDGCYTAGQLDISVDDLACLRAETICSALNAFRPEVMIVDKVPTGAFGEMLPALSNLSKKFGTKCVLGIRDVLDEAEVVRSEWFQSSHEAIEEFYDQLWIYGDVRIYDPVKEYGWHEGIADKVCHTGYLDQTRRLHHPCVKSSQEITEICPNGEQLIVCTLGGGQDGFPLAKAFVESLPKAETMGVLLVGPYMPSDLLRRLYDYAAHRENIRILEFIPEADQLVQRADRVVAMGGYNTVCSILSFRKPALLVPRVSPRKEQWIRAQCLKQNGLLDVVHPDDLTPSVLRAWFEKEVQAPRVHPEVIDFAGLERVTQLVAGLVGQQVHELALPKRETV